MTSRCLVVDTNVLAVAEGMHPEASPECVLNCVRHLKRIDSGVTLAVDVDDEILLEYLGTLRRAATPGLATKLVSRLYRLRWDDDGPCRRVAITRRAERPGVYEEVPHGLRDFDEDDQKFLAVAAAEGGNPQVLQALDSKWYERSDDFRAAGIDVQFLCLADLLDAE